jgi:hypothetical protein
MVEHDLNDNAAQIAVLRPEAPGQPDIIVGNIHVLFNTKRGDVKLGQASLLRVCARARGITPVSCLVCLILLLCSHCGHLSLAESELAVSTNVMCLQVRTLLHCAEDAVASRAPNASGDLPPCAVALMGDFNSSAHSALYRLAPLHPHG